MMARPVAPVITVMLAVSDAPSAAAWYKQALGATELWNLGSVIGLDIAGAPFLLGEPENNGWETPAALGMPSCRVEVFCDDPDLMERAVRAGAVGSGRVSEYAIPWGTHRQRVFTDPVGHLWFVGDRSPMTRLSSTSRTAQADPAVALHFATLYVDRVMLYARA